MLLIPEQENLSEVFQSHCFYLNFYYSTGVSGGFSLTFVLEGGKGSSIMLAFTFEALLFLSTASKPCS